MSANALRDQRYRNAWDLELQVVARWVLQFLQKQCVLSAELFLQAPWQKL